MVDMFKVNIGNLSTAYYQDIDTHANYAQVGWTLEFLPVMLGTFELVYAGTHKDETFTQLNWSYEPITFPNLTILGIVGEDVFEGQTADSINLELVYNFR